MDETHRRSPAGSSHDPVPATAAGATEQTVSAGDDPASLPGSAHSSGTDARPKRTRIDAGNTALLIGIIVGLIGSVSVLIGIPVFLLNEGVNRARDEIDALDAKMDAKFDAQNTKIDNRFAAQDARINNRFDALEDKIDNRFAAQDTEIEELRRGLSEIDRKLAVLIASLSQTVSADGALEGALAR